MGISINCNSIRHDIIIKFCVMKCILITGYFNFLSSHSELHFIGSVYFVQDMLDTGFYSGLHLFVVLKTRLFLNDNCMFVYPCVIDLVSIS